MNNSLLITAKEILDKHGIKTCLEKKNIGILLHDMTNHSIFYEYITTDFSKLVFFIPKFLTFTPYTDYDNVLIQHVIVRYDRVSISEYDDALVARLAETYAKLIDCIRQAKNDCIDYIEELTQLYNARLETKSHSIDNLPVTYTDLFIEQRTRHLNAMMNELFKIYSQEIQVFS